MGKRFVMRIELTQGSRGKISALSKHLGMTQLAMVSRLVDWFAMQDDAIQLACLDLYPGDLRPEIAKLILDKMAQKGPRR